VTAGAAAPRRHPRLAVDLLAALSMVGLIVRWLSLALAAPLVVALLEGEGVVPFAIPLVGGFAGGYALQRACGRREGDVGLREAFAVVALAWLAAALLGAVPYLLDGGDIANPLDAYFEAMSGFTTTGASVMGDIASHDRSILFWRSMTQWLGGMGIIVLAIAVLGQTGAAGRALFQQESPGPDAEKLTPRLRDTAVRLWLVYVAFSAALVVALWMAGRVTSDGMGLYDAIAHAFTTMSTGGFSPEPRSMEAFDGVAQAIVAIFMVAAGVNFALWYRAARGDARPLRRDGELRAYLAVIAVATALIAVVLVVADGDTAASGLGAAAFQAISIVTTTGFASADFATWSAFALLVLFSLMFIGGCSGSTSGAMKVIRVRLALGGARRDVETAVHPEKILPVRASGRPVPEPAVRAATAFAGLYLAAFAVGAAAILLTAALHGRDLGAFDAMVAAATSLGNVGPGVGEAGPMGSFAAYPAEAKATMITLMWIGRLELLPVLVLVTRAYWLR
jgi:trk system potassium uptake protein TrkH